MFMIPLMCLAGFAAVVMMRSIDADAREKAEDEAERKKIGASKREGEGTSKEGEGEKKKIVEAAKEGPTVRNRKQK
jgi:hypothetical protein